MSECAIIVHIFYAAVINISHKRLCASCTVFTRARTRTHAELPRNVRMCVRVWTSAQTLGAHAGASKIRTSPIGWNE